MSSGSIPTILAGILICEKSGNIFLELFPVLPAFFHFTRICNRSKFTSFHLTEYGKVNIGCDNSYLFAGCESGGIGRRTGLRIQRVTVGVRVPPLAPKPETYTERKRGK